MNDTSRLDAVFAPRRVAVVGASRRRGTIGGEIFHNLLAYGFQGVVYPVNPSASVVQGVHAYPSARACPEPPDLAILAVPAEHVAAAAADCVAAGVRALVVISAGFAETDADGVARQEALRRCVLGGGARLVGPNCMGVVNTDPAVRLNGQFSPFVPLEGRIGFLSQSGALGIAVMDHANRLGLGLSQFVSVGNRADVSANDCIEWWERDPHTDLILLYLETFGNPRKFARLARRVARRKPIIAVKGGRSAAGFRATQSHTGALVAASEVTVDALCRQAGVIRTETLGEMFDVAALLATQPVPRGDRVGIVTNAGGIGILAADACSAAGLQVPELSGATQAALREFLPAAAGVRNPVDLIASATAQQFGRAIRVLGRDPGVDALLVIFIPPIALRPEAVAAELLAETRALAGRLPVLALFMASHGLPPMLAAEGLRIPSYPFPESAARALARAVAYGRWLARPEPPETGPRPARPAVVDRAVADADGWLPPDAVGALLDAYGLPRAAAVLAPTPAAAADAAERIGGPVALKAVAPGLVHKTEVGAVALDLRGRAAVETAARAMAARVGAAGPAVTAFLVQAMVPRGIEMLVGVTHDPDFGPVLVCGGGGTLVELFRDVAVRVTPLAPDDPGEMVRSLRTFALLEGYRGAPRHDIAALEDLVRRVGQMVEDIPELMELDLNPVIVQPGTGGAIVVDARIRIGSAAARR